MSVAQKKRLVHKTAANDLQAEIESARAEIKTDSYAMSIGEWASLYTSGELDIHPEFQRFFRWTPTQKSVFIESILLGIPIPPIFIAQSKEGIWEVVDGLQRLSTIFEFMGILKDENNSEKVPLVLERTEYLPSLEGKKWDDEDDTKYSLTPAQRLLIKRAKFYVNIILPESERMAKYELFQRLNTGGSQLTDQEVRNCIIVMLDRSFYSWLRDLADYDSFQQSIALSDNSIVEQYDMELAVRFIVFRKMKEDHLSKIGDVGRFLTDEMKNIIQNSSFNRNKEGKIFRDTFDFIAASYGPNAFHRFDISKNRHMGGFLISAYEVIALGLGYNDAKFSSGVEIFSKRITHLWGDVEFNKYSGSGVSAKSRIPKLIPLGRQRFA